MIYAYPVIITILSFFTTKMTREKEVVGKVMVFETSERQISVAVCSIQDKKGSFSRKLFPFYFPSNSLTILRIYFLYCWQTGESTYAPRFLPFSVGKMCYWFWRRWVYPKPARVRESEGENLCISYSSLSWKSCLYASSPYLLLRAITLHYEYFPFFRFFLSVQFYLKYQSNCRYGDAVMISSLWVQFSMSALVFFSCYRN